MKNQNGERNNKKHIVLERGNCNCREESKRPLSQPTCTTDTAASVMVAKPAGQSMAMPLSLPAGQYFPLVHGRQF
jgi:hypothetical protein